MEPEKDNIFFALCRLQHNRVHCASVWLDTCLSLRTHSGHSVHGMHWKSMAQRSELLMHTDNYWSLGCILTFQRVSIKWRRKVVKRRKTVKCFCMHWKYGEYEHEHTTREKCLCSKTAWDLHANEGSSGERAQRAHKFVRKTETPSSANNISLYKCMFAHWNSMFVLLPNTLAHESVCGRRSTRSHHSTRVSFNFLFLFPFDIDGWFAYDAWKTDSEDSGSYDDDIMTHY